MQVRVIVHKVKFGKDRSNPSAIYSCTDDPASILPVAATGWRLSGVAIPYWVNFESAPVAIRNNLSAIVSNSFDTWVSGSNGKYSFTYAGISSLAVPTADGINIVAWGSAPSNALAITYIWYNRRTKIVSNIDTIMNNAFSWSWWDWSTVNCSATDYDAQNILTHEIGHWVGLNDEYNAKSYQHATMYGYGARAEIKKDTLSQSDLFGIKNIYR